MNEESRRRFEAEPERFAIQWGGGCGGMGPLSGRGDPDHFAVHAGRIWIFASDGCREDFLAEPERYAAAPEPAAPADPAAIARGRELLERAARAHGLAADGRVARPSKWTMDTGCKVTFETSWVLSAESARRVKGGATLPLTSPAQLDDLCRHAQREPLAFLWAHERAVAADLGPGRLGETEVERVRVELDGLVTTLLLAPDDGRVLGLAWRGRSNEGVTREIVESLTVWTEIDGVRLPLAHRTTADGEERAGLARSSAELLGEIPDGAF